MGKKIALFLLIVSFLSCKKEEQEKVTAEASIEGNWILKTAHREYFNAAGTKVYSSEGPVSDVSYQFAAATVINSSDPKTKSYAITMDGSKKILTIQGEPPIIEIRSLNLSTMIWFRTYDTNGANSIVYHDGILTQYTKATELTTLNKM